MSREPQLLDPNRARPELIGISGGLFSAALVSISTDFESLYDACLEAGRVWSRLCNLTLVRSRAMEERPGTWGWAVLGMPAEELGKTMEQFQNAKVCSFPELLLIVAVAADSRPTGSPIRQESKGWCQWRQMEHCHRATFYLGVRLERMSCTEESSKERARYPCPSAHPKHLRSRYRLYCREFPTSGHTFTIGL